MSTKLGLTQAKKILMNAQIDKLKQQAQILLNKQKFGQAKTLYAQICEIDSQDAQAWFVLGAINGHLREADEAIVCCRQAIAIQPEFPVAYYNLSLALKDKGDIEGAIENCCQALMQQPAYVEAHNSLGSLFTATHRYEEAAESFRKVLSLSPRFALAHVNLGNVLLAIQSFDEAIRSYHAAIGIQPNLAEAHDALGVALYEQGKPAKAVDCHQMAIRINPNFVEAYVNLGVVLVSMGALKPALTHLRTAIRLRPDSLIITRVGHAHYTLGKALVDLEKYDEAIECYLQALALEPDVADTYIHLGVAYLDSGRRDAAREAFQQARRIKPDSGPATYYLSSLGETLESRAEAAAFIADIFDQYAPTYDGHMNGGLQCKVPEMIERDVRAALGPRLAELDVLDLGCGTGKCGMLFHDLLGRMVGIDLSPKMVEQARQRGVYAEVYTGDLMQFLRELSGCFDLILSADVFVYIADLDPVFCEVSRVLRPGGLFAFSLEEGERKVPTLMASGRIVHSKEYMRDIAAAHGLIEVSVVDEELRINTHGFIAVLRKPCHTGSQVHAS